MLIPTLTGVVQTVLMIIHWWPKDLHEWPLTFFFYHKRNLKIQLLMWCKKRSEEASLRRYLVAMDDMGRQCFTLQASPAKSHGESLVTAGPYKIYKSDDWRILSCIGGSQSSTFLPKARDKEIWYHRRLLRPTLDWSDVEGPSKESEIAWYSCRWPWVKDNHIVWGWRTKGKT